MTLLTNTLSSWVIWYGLREWLAAHPVCVRARARARVCGQIYGYTHSPAHLPIPPSFVLHPRTRGRAHTHAHTRTGRVLTGSAFCIATDSACWGEQFELDQPPTPHSPELVFLGLPNVCKKLC